MRKLTRNYNATHGGFRGQHLKNKIKWLFEQQREKLKGNIDKITWKNRRYWKNTKPQLIAETFGKCAYCEANTRTVAYGDVEHYRPTSIYWWLAYTYYNYLFSCQICNQVYKSDNFPTLNNRLVGPEILTTTNNIELEGLIEPYILDPKDINTENSILGLSKLNEQELPTLLNPYLKDPADWFEWEFDDNERSIRLRAKKNNITSKQFVETAIQYLGLNREELMNLRYETFSVFRTFRRTLNEVTDNPSLYAEVQEQLEQMQQPSAVFSGMCVYFGGLLLSELVSNPLS